MGRKDDCSIAAEASELHACPPYTELYPPQSPRKAWTASPHSTSRGGKRQDLGSLVLSVSDSQCHPPFPYRLRGPASQPASLPSHPYREARQRSTHALFSEPFQSSLLPLATSLNSSPPRTAHPGSSGTSGQPHLLPGLTPTRSSSTYNASSPHMLFPVSNSLLLGPGSPVKLLPSFQDAVLPCASFTQLPWTTLFCAPKYPVPTCVTT